MSGGGNREFVNKEEALNYFKETVEVIANKAMVDTLKLWYLLTTKYILACCKRKHFQMLILFSKGMFLYSLSRKLNVIFKFYSN